MSFAFGPLTDVLGTTLTVTSDGSGGLILSCPKYSGSPLAVSAAQLTNTTTAMLVQRLVAAEDFYTNWRNLSAQLGLGDPGDTQIGSPE